MLRRLIFLFAILPGVTLADPPLPTMNAPPPLPPPGLTPGAHGHRHSCLQNYPEAEMRAGIEGTTMLSFVVTAEGTVTDVTVSKSSGNTDLDAAAVACAGTWTYKPATKKGVPIAVALAGIGRMEAPR